MPANPFRRPTPPPYARAIDAAEAALALARHRLATASRPRVPSGSSLGPKVIVGGIAGATGAVLVVLKRRRIADVVPFVGSSAPEAPDAPPTAPEPPEPSNYDLSGPAANTATAVPAPDPQDPTGFDEEAEIAAAAAEAAAIGGAAGSSDYVDSEGMAVDEAERPLFEAGEGDAEGLEQAEALLEENAILRDDAPSDAELQIDEVIEEQDNPLAGETPEPLVTEEDEDPGSRT